MSSYTSVPFRGVITLLLISASFTMKAQSFIVLRGEVRDSTSGKPLDHATITIAGRGIGTMTNVDGKFEFNIPIACRHDTLVVSFLGYNNYRRVVSSLAGNTSLIISCIPAVVTLTAVTVTSGPCNVGCLISKVLETYDENYSTRPFVVEGFYRETRSKNNEFGYLLEAACKIYKSSYKNEPDVALEKLRSSFMKDNMGLNPDENFLETLLKNDYVSNSFMGFYRRYSKKTKYVMEDTTMLNNVPVYVISTGSLPGWKQTFSISADDYAIVRFEGESNYGFGESVPAPGKNAEFRYRHLKVINDFTRLDGRYFLTRLKMTLDGDNHSGNYMVLDREFVVNLINTVSPHPPADNERMKSIRLEEQLKKYDTTFWKNYNLVKRTPVQEKLIHDLEESMTLEEQFKQQTPLSRKKK